MPHLAARTRFALAVDVDIDVRVSLRGDLLSLLQIPSEDVFHHRRGLQLGTLQRHVQKIAAQLAELVCRAALDRIVAAVVGTWSHLVKEDLVSAHEVFDGQNAAVPAIAHETHALLLHAASYIIPHLRSRHDAQVENTLAVDVPSYGE